MTPYHGAHQLKPGQDTVLRGAPDMMTTNGTDAEIPRGWKKLPLQSLCLKTSVIDPTENPHQSFQYVDVSAISNELWKITSSTGHTGATAPSRARKLVKAHDILFATVRPTLKRIALVPDHLDGQIVSTAFCVLRADPTLADSRFIYYSLLTDEFVNRIGNLQRGASYPAVTDGDVLDQEILLPPVSEQQAIAGVLSKIQTAIEVQDKIVATLKELKAASMAKLFREGLRGEPLKQTEIGEIPESWEVVRLGDAASIRYGLGQPPELCPDGVPMIRATDISRGRILARDVLRVRQESIPMSRNPFLKPGDIIVVRSGAYTGDAAVITKEWEDAIAGYDLIVTPLESLDPFFAVNFLLGPNAQGYFRRQRHRAAQPHINSQQLSETLLPLPVLEEQRAVGQILRTIDSKTAYSERKRESLKAAFSSMLHRLMTGEIRLPGFGRTPNLDSPWFKPEDVWEFVARLVRKFDPERVILFGSRAWGTPRRDSDVDLLVVIEFEGRPVDMAVRIGAECDDRFPLDLIVRRPTEVQQRIAMGDSFYKQILRDGLVLHERAA